MMSQRFGGEPDRSRRTGPDLQAKIIDVTNTTVSLEMTGTLDKIDSFLSLISPYGIVGFGPNRNNSLGRSKPSS